MMYNLINILIVLGLFCLSFMIVRMFIKSPDLNIYKGSRIKKITIVMLTYVKRTLLSILVLILFLRVFTYPKVAEVENTLKNPINVIKVIESNIYLEGGRIIKCTIEKDILDYSISRSNYKIELKDCGTPPGFFFEIYINSPRGLCGNEFGWIPLIPMPRKLKAYKYRLTYGEINE